MFIMENYYSGMDWHDRRKDYRMIGDVNCGYKVSEKDVAVMIFNAVKENIHISNEHADALLDAIKNKRKYICPIYYDANDNKPLGEFNPMKMQNSLEFKYSSEVYSNIVGTYKFDAFYRGGFDINISYEIADIKDPDVLYVVSEDFPAPIRGVPLCQRLYHLPFKKCADAISYMNEANQKLEKMRYKREESVAAKESCFNCLVFSKQHLDESEWYRIQLEVMKLMEQTNTDEYHPEYTIWNVDRHKMQIKKEFDDSLHV